MTTFDITLDQLNSLNKNTLGEHLGIEFIEVGADFIKARMPVDRRTVQPFGLLHGGASVSLAETLGSIAAQVTAGMDRWCVGLEINANHLKSVRSGYVYGVTKAIRIGRTVQVWEVEITNDQGDMICKSRMTVAVLDRKET